MNEKKSSKELAKLASEVLRNPAASKIQKELAGSVLSQSKTKNQTSSVMEHKAGKALQNDRSAEVTRKLAASVVSQSNKKR